MKVPVYVGNFKKSSIEGVRDLKRIQSVGDFLAIFLPSYFWWRPANYDIILCYYPTALRRAQIRPKTSTNIMRYSCSRGPIRQVSCC